jgi:hypothetical protein
MYHVDNPRELGDNLKNQVNNWQVLPAETVGAVADSRTLGGSKWHVSRER